MGRQVDIWGSEAVNNAIPTLIGYVDQSDNPIYSTKALSYLVQILCGVFNFSGLTTQSYNLIGILEGRLSSGDLGETEQHVARVVISLQKKIYGLPVAADVVDIDNTIQELYRRATDVSARMNVQGKIKLFLRDQIQGGIES